MVFGLPTPGEPNWDVKLDASIEAVKTTADDAAAEIAGRLSESSLTASIVDRALGTATDQVVYVSKSTKADDGNDGLSWGRPMATLQAAIDALPSTGGTVMAGAGTFAPFVTDKANLTIVGVGSPGQDGTVGEGATVIDVSATGAKIGTTSASEIFRGFTFRGLHFRGGASTTIGLEIGRVSNFLIDRCTVSDCTTGTAIQVTGSGSSQYGTIRDTLIEDSLIGLDVVNHNGLRVFGGTIENLPSGGSTYVAGTIGIRIGSDSDSARLSNIITQFLETCYDITGENTYIEAPRCEAFSTGIIFRGDRGTLGPGSQFNNFIIDGGGTCVSITADATRTRIFPHNHAVTGAPAVVNAGTGTDRRDATRIRLFVPLINATTTIPVVVPAHSRSFMVSNVQLIHDGVDPGTTYANRWTVSVTGRNGTAESYFTGWAPDTVISLFGEPGGSDTARGSGTVIQVSFTKSGTVTDLTNVTIEFDLVEY